MRRDIFVSAPTRFCVSIIRNFNYNLKFSIRELRKRNMEEAVASLEAKLVQLNMAKIRGERISLDRLESNDHARIERQQETLQNLISEVNTCKNTVEGMKIAQKVSLEEIEAWNMEV